MSIPGYPSASPSLAFSVAEHPELVVDLPAADVVDSLVAGTNQRIEQWSAAASERLDACYRQVFAASQSQLETLAALLAGAGVDVDAVAWTSELEASEVGFAWAAAAQGCVLAILDLVADSPDSVLHADHVPKLAAARVDPQRFTRATGLEHDHQDLAIAETWQAISSTFTGPLLYRQRYVHLTQQGSDLRISRFIRVVER